MWNVTVVLPWRVDGRWGWLLASYWGTRKKHYRCVATCSNWGTLPAIQETLRKMKERNR